MHLNGMDGDEYIKTSDFDISNSNNGKNTTFSTMQKSFFENKMVFN